MKRSDEPVEEGPSFEEVFASADAAEGETLLAELSGLSRAGAGG